MFAKGDRVITPDGVGVVTSRLNEFTLEVDVDDCGLGYYDPKECVLSAQSGQKTNKVCVDGKFVEVKCEGVKKE